MGKVDGIKIDDKAVKDLVDKVLNQKTEYMVRQGKKAFKDLREGAVGTWMNNGNGRHQKINAATVYWHEITQTSDDYIVTIHSYVDAGLLKQIGLSGTIYKWYEEHRKSEWIYKGKDTPTTKRGTVFKKAVDMPYTPEEYYVKLKWDFGYIGLPPRETKTGTGWVNEHFVARNQTMKQYVEEQISTRWDTHVQKYFK